MTKTHFQAIAEALALALEQTMELGSSRPANRALAIQIDLIEHIADICAKANPEFNREVFIRATRREA